MAFECMNDCIHLKACRRVQAIGKRYRLLVPRYCTSECTAYISGEKYAFLTPNEACDVARYEYDGHSDPYDVYCPWDFPSQTLGEIINGLQEEADNGMDQQ